MKKKAPHDSPLLVDFKQLISRVFDAIKSEDRAVYPIRPATEAELAQVPHLEWVPDNLLAFMRLRNGVRVEWHVDEPGTGRREEGQVSIRPIQVIYGNWEGIVWFDDEPAEQQARMQPFKIVDYFADEACVGLYHTAARDPQLYFYDFEDAPRPLGVDFLGYLALLPHTLGLRYWQLLLLELDAPASHARPWRPQQLPAQRTLQRLQQYVPGFDLDAFVQRYDEVRLHR